MLKFLLKVILSVAIFVWLFSKGMIDFHFVRMIFNMPYVVLGAIMILVVQVFLGAYRWNLFVDQSVPEHFKFRSIVSVQWIGLFFSGVLPGAVAGDFIKVGYLSIHGKSTKKYLLFTVILDRLIGLAGLVFVCGMGSLFFYNDIIHLNPVLDKLIYLLVSASGAMIVAFALVAPGDGKLLWQFTERFSFFKNLKAQPDIVLKTSKAFFLSIVGHLLGISAFWTLSLPLLPAPITMKYAVTLIPIGELAMVLPISVSGLGVGHMAFERLFSLAQIMNGASLFNVFWIFVFLVNLVGVIPFLFYKNSAEKI